jgi:cellulose synthase/poly-beta-1,6-N-acetylglucosamine synthase-like glycosyltransferase
VWHYKDDNSDNIEELYYYIVLPCLNEEKVIGRTIKNLLSIDFPNVTVFAINDASNDNTKNILESFENEKLIILNRVLPNARLGKGFALNDAYKHIVADVNQKKINHSKVVIGILDADTYIKPSLIKRVNDIMAQDEKAGMVQTRVRIGISTRDYFLPFMQDIEFFSCINQMQNVREYMGTVAAAGNGQFNRLSAMEELGDEPWSKCLLEDFDFSLRLLFSGWRTRLLQDENVFQQGVTNYKKFIKQRARWVQGCIQCIPYAKEVVKAKPLSFWGKAEILYFLLLPIISMISTLVLAFSWFLIMYTFLNDSSILLERLEQLSTPNLATLLVVLVIAIYLPGVIFSIRYWIDTKEGFLRCILAGLFMPMYNMMQIPAVVLAVYRHATGKNSWTKTERS